MPIRPRQLPECTECHTVAQSQLFTIEALSLTFTNGEQRRYERLKPRISGAVMILAQTDDGQVLLVREYAAGTERYELGFPKGIVEPQETVFEAANRELKEEVGVGAKRFRHLKSLSATPAYFGMMVEVVLAQGLYPEALVGDEPEPLEVVPWPINKLVDLLSREDFSEARSIAAVLLLQQTLT